MSTRQYLAFVILKRPTTVTEGQSGMLGAYQAKVFAVLANTTDEAGRKAQTFAGKEWTKAAVASITWAHDIELANFQAILKQVQL